MKKLKYKNLTPEQAKIYQSFSAAKRRCVDKNLIGYEYYGGRGIKYKLEDNKTRLELVAEHEEAWMKVKRKHLNDIITINRIDQNKHYEEGNIEWVTLSENVRQMNRHYGEGSPGGRARMKKVKCITTGEVFDCAREASRELGIDNSVLAKCAKGLRKSAGKTKVGHKRVWKYL